MGVRFDTSIYYRAKADDVFDLFSDPDELNRASESKLGPVTGLSAPPGTEGVTWTQRLGPLSLCSVQSRVRRAYYPQVLETTFEGAITGSRALKFSARSSGTIVEQCVEFQRHSALLGARRARGFAEIFLPSLKFHFEPIDSDPEFNNIETSRPFDDGLQLFDERADLTFKYQCFIRSSRQQVFSRIIRDLSSAWEWEVDRCDPNTIYTPRSSWPAKGARAFYHYSSAIGDNGSERGCLSILEFDEPKVLTVREDQYTSTQSRSWTSYELTEVDNAIRLDVDNGLKLLKKSLAVRLKDSESRQFFQALFRKRVANLKRVCEAI